MSHTGIFFHQERFLWLCRLDFKVSMVDANFTLNASRKEKQSESLQSGLLYNHENQNIIWYMPPKKTKYKYYYIYLWIFMAAGPLESTTDLFWRMLMEQNISIIVMITHLFEGGKVSSSLCIITSSATDEIPNHCRFA